MAQKVLILEDERSVGEVYAMGIRAAGYDVRVHTTFEDARAELKNDLPDAVITDVRVGEFNGLQLAIIFRSLSPNGKIAVVTGHDDPVIKKEAERLGATFLTKPIELRWLMNFLTDDPRPH